MSNEDGWDESASAWIRHLGDHGDFGRKFVLDPPMMHHVRSGEFATALDVGCGEGRFCRMMQTRGVRTVGIDPTEALLEQARSLDPRGDYRRGRAEALEFPDRSFDLVISYLTLIDIPDVGRAVQEMARVLRPGGTLLIANLSSFFTAAVGGGWSTDSLGEPRFLIDEYLVERADWVEWRNIRIRNWHRPLAEYLAPLLSQGLILRDFQEPSPIGGDPEIAARYRRVPWFVLMRWEKPKETEMGVCPSQFSQDG